MAKSEMNGINKTMYIPLYGKAYVSERGLFLNDKKAEEIWEAEKFPLKGKSKSKWLAYYMGIRSRVFDEWVKSELSERDDALVLHIGCGMDSRVLRIADSHLWYDIDFPEVIKERKRYYSESDNYKMLSCDVRETDWVNQLAPKKKAIVVMEGVSMYITLNELRTILEKICSHFDEVSLLVDCYTELAAKMSKYKNPINDVGVTNVYGIDNPELIKIDSLSFVKEHDMTPKVYINELSGMEKKLFCKLFAGNFSKKLYKMYEYKKDKTTENS